MVLIFTYTWFKNIFKEIKFLSYNRRWYTIKTSRGLVSISSIQEVKKGSLVVFSKLLLPKSEVNNPFIKSPNAQTYQVNCFIN